MARKLRLQYEGAIYHVVVRGNGRRRMFLDDRDRDRLLWRLCESRELFETRVYAYCLMDNHFHLLVETPRANISEYMHSVLTGYSVYFNLRHDTSGHVQQGRFKAQLVKGDRYLLGVSRYIHLNPIHVKRCEEWTASRKAQYLAAYRWSSYRGYIDPRKQNELVDYGPLLGLMGGRRKDKPARYRKFVRGGLVQLDEDLAEMIGSETRGIGDRDFREWVDEEYQKLQKGMGSPEDVSFRKEVKVLDPETIVKKVTGIYRVQADELRRRRRGSLLRPVAARMLCKYGGLTQREVAKRLGYGTGAAVCMQLKRLQEALSDPGSGVSRKVARIEKKLKALR